MVEQKVMDKGDSANRGNQLLQLVSFRVGSEEFGVDILRVQEINRMVEITRVPNSPEFVEGVINLRGKIIPIIALRKRFGLKDKSPDKYTRIIVADVDNKIVGFVVDAVLEVLRIPTDTIEPPPPIVAGVDASYIRGVAKLEDRLLILLNLEEVFSEQEKRALNPTG